MWLPDDPPWRSKGLKWGTVLQKVWPIRKQYRHLVDAAEKDGTAFEWAQLDCGLLALLYRILRRSYLNPTQDMVAAQ